MPFDNPELDTDALKAQLNELNAVGRVSIVRLPITRGLGDAVSAAEQKSHTMGCIVQGLGDAAKAVLVRALTENGIQFHAGAKSSLVAIYEDSLAAEGKLAALQAALGGTAPDTGKSQGSGGRGR